MRVVRIVLAVFLLVLLSSIPVNAVAEETGALNINIKDRMALQVVSGLVSSPTFLASRTPDMDYWMTNIRVGWMFTDPCETTSFLRGNWETLFELTNSYIYEGPGTHMIGFTGFIRYNFVRPDARIVPYFQVGAGIVYTDADEDLSQNAVGRSIEFTPQGGMGAHFILTRNWALDAEAIFHHISNAGFDDRNRGINAFGGFIGVTYYFDDLWQ